ncbi:hypothetical protein D3C84_921870 [compost metagenome]
MCPAAMCRPTASQSAAGAEKSGKPWDRLMAPVSAASWDIWVKMVVPTLGNLLAIISSGCWRLGSGA